MEKEGREAAVKPKEYYINVDPKEAPESGLRMIRALYAIGADIIHIHFKNVKNARYRMETKILCEIPSLGQK